MSEIKKRLQEAADACVKSYEAWDSSKGDAKTREELQESIHELRKVSSRLEIEIAVSERGKISDSPIPIPTHRSTSKAKGAVESILPEDNNTGNKKEASNGGGARRPRGGGRRTGGKKQGD